MSKRFFKRRQRTILTMRIAALLSHRLFWTLTVVGNGMILLGSTLLYLFESTKQIEFQFIDSVLWSTSIITTIGYSSYTPYSFPGKLTVIFLMLFGTVFLWSYMAFFVSALISPALSSLEKEVQDVEREISEIKLEENKSYSQTRGDYEKHKKI